MIAEIDTKTVEISGNALSAYITGFPDYLSDIAETILQNNNLQHPEQGKWYNFHDYLAALDDIGKKFGSSSLYEIGKQAVNSSIIPEGVVTFVDAINNLQKAFEINHRNGQICEIKILKMKVSKGKVILEIINPYPFEVNRGILTGLSRNYTPNESVMPDVEIDENKSNFPVGIYTITW
ncbi:MAG: hypothetical protein JEZ09_19655 [Salinivirgaceae bacterium]|nr:hypothetical protein [Salinivirgaceae bacterium]